MMVFLNLRNQKRVLILRNQRRLKEEDDLGVTVEIFE